MDHSGLVPFLLQEFSKTPILFDVKFLSHVLLLYNQFRYKSLFYMQMSDLEHCYSPPFTMCMSLLAIRLSYMPDLTPRPSPQLDTT
jgi:hypothetical protein